jgi:hypothetical protein
MAGNYHIHSSNIDFALVKLLAVEVGEFVIIDQVTVQYWKPTSQEHLGC